MGPPGDISRQRARRAFSCDAAALVSERSGVVPAGADSFASGRSLEHFPEDYNHYNEERKVPAAWVRSGSREKGVYAGGASYSGFIEDRFAVGDDNIVRGNSTAPAHSQPPASDWSPSTRIISTEGSEAGDRRSFAHASSGSRLRTPLLDPEFRASSRNGSQRTTPGRRASSAMSAVDGRDLWVKCFEKARRVSAPDYVERVAKLDRQADKDRVLRCVLSYLLTDFDVSFFLALMTPPCRESCACCPTPFFHQAPGRFLLMVFFMAWKIFCWSEYPHCPFLEVPRRSRDCLSDVGVDQPRYQRKARASPCIMSA